jgi:hypothetical protein
MARIENLPDVLGQLPGRDTIPTPRQAPAPTVQFIYTSDAPCIQIRRLPADMVYTPATENRLEERAAALFLLGERSDDFSSDVEEEDGGDEG